MASSTYTVVGIMSGTSLDGIDVALCEFTKTENWKFRIIRAETFPYDAYWKNILENIHNDSALNYRKADVSYGKYLGSQVRSFLNAGDKKPDFISSHGHTIFHQPNTGFTSQLGDGAALSASSGIPVVCDFRSLDVALGGQGAPLVPIGDRLLFSEFENCLNLGGIANISFEKNGERIAFDVCPCNLVLNKLAQRKGMQYDKNGSLGRSGKLNEHLLAALNQLSYYKKSFPKSLGREDVEQLFMPLIDSIAIPLEDSISTFCEHIAQQITKETSEGKLLITGGGAFNSYLVERIREHEARKGRKEVELPDPTIINFKEALIFAFLGVLRWRNEVNCLRSVTGAVRDSSGGAVYLV